MSSVLLLSGGLDSAAHLVLVDSVSLALTVDYGQRAARREIQAARALCREYGVPHEVLSIENWLGDLDNALTNPALPLPKPRVENGDLDRLESAHRSAQAVWVPNRNGLLIQLAAAIAEARGFEKVWVGFNREEAATFLDNSVGFLEATNRALSFSTRNQVRLDSKTIAWDKKEIVFELRKRSFDFGKLWSCYEGGEVPCEVCESCSRLKRALSVREAVHVS